MKDWQRTEARSRFWMGIATGLAVGLALGGRSAAFVFAGYLTVSGIIIYAIFLSKRVSREWRQDVDAMLKRARDAIDGAGGSVIAEREK